MLDPGWLRELRTVEESMSVNKPGQPSIIISASGMASGGRVLHLLRYLLPDPRMTVLIVGFAALGTRSRNLVDGATASRRRWRPGRPFSATRRLVGQPGRRPWGPGGRTPAWPA
ncbi:hypothetical protein [Nonomuraea turcica]|uniref:hypothetical protein n=1 Tax=Nonomuraea sp. G32 TaxID=3067274 RepID=UPI00273B0583|nr:hypothetical protein [Nonomuraea sp. G32]MDP4510025.1 hypothetical protein [Nonomuraea sp. G32]